ncbi:MAG: sugar ABC transporter permease [Chloroflexi bacterium]|nr:sugar ABC transporter permease [Chloroflexota bacterium]
MNSRSQVVRRGQVAMPRSDRVRHVLQRAWRFRVLYLLLLPSFGLLALFSYYPVMSGLVHAFYRWDGYHATFIGLENFQRFFTDLALVQSFRNLTLLLLFALATNLTVPMVVAALIYHLPHAPSRYWFRVGYTLPIVVPHVVVWLIWVFMYTNYGGINSFLSAIGLRSLTLTADGLPRAWLGDQRTALLGIMFVGFPWVNTINMLLYLAGFEAIPSEVMDAATVDGATGLAMFRRIELPLIMGQVKLIVVLTTIGVLQGFQSILVMTRGGPGYATMVPGLRLFNAAVPGSHAAEAPQMGYGSAIGVVLFAIIMAVTILNMRVMRSGTALEAI